MPCLPLPSGECLPIPEWECSDVQCFQQCVNQPSFSSFFECCIQCALAHYQAEAKDHVSFVISQAVYLFGNEYIPVADQMFMLPARYVLVTQNEQVVVNDQGYPGLYRVVTASGSESISVEEFGQPCLSSFGPCIPPGVTSSETLLRLGMGVSGGVGFGFGFGFGGISSAGASSPSSPAFPPPTTPPFYTPPIPPAPPPGTPPTSSTTTVVTSRSCPDVCPGCICYYMLGIEIVDPADATYSYQETPTGIVLSAPFSEIPVVSDLLSLEEAPSQLQDTTQSIDVVNFSIAYVTQVTYTVLDILFAPRITSLLFPYHISATESVLSLSVFSPISRVTRSVLSTFEGQVISSLVTYTPSPVLVPSITQSEQPVLDLRFSPITALRTLVPTIVSTAIQLVNLNAPPSPHVVGEPSSVVARVLSAHVYSVIKQVLLSFSVSAVQEIVDYLIHYVIPEIVTSVPTSNTQEIMDLVIHHLVEEIITTLSTSQTSRVLTAEWALVVEKLIESVPSSELQTVLDLDLAQKVYALLSSITSQEISTILDAYATQKVTETLNRILSSYPTSISYVDLSEKVSITAFGEVSTQTEAGVIDATFGISTYSITITNNQSVATPTPFQQMLNLNLSGIISSPSQLLNLLFCSDSSCSSPLYAWIENYNSNLSSVIVWVNLPNGVPANSSITIYMMVTNSSQYPYTGVSPIVAQNLGISLSSYDNGTKVFLFYSNGTSTSQFPDQHVGSGGSISTTSSGPSPYPYDIVASVNGGNANANSWSTLGNLSFSLPSSYIVQVLVYITGSSALTDVLTNVGNIVTGPFFVFRFDTRSGAYDAIGYYPSGGTYTEFLAYGTYQSSTNTWYQMTVVNVNGYLYLYKSTTFSLSNYGTEEYSYNTAGTSYALSGGGIAITTDGSTSTEYWPLVLVRQYPPNGVMPSNSQPTA